MRLTIRERLVQLLNEALKPDTLITADDLWLQQGGYRHARWGLARWGGYARIGGASRTLCSFDTMTQCVHRGIVVSRETVNSYADYEIHAAEQELAMICLGPAERKDRTALEARKAYVLRLLDEPRPRATPSSEEWVSDEFWQGHRRMLTEEIDEIDTVLARMNSLE